MNSGLLKIAPKDISNLTLLGPEETLEILGFGKQEEIRKFFNGKNISDIGGGYGGLVQIIRDFGNPKSINSVDSCFQDSLEMIKSRNKEFLADVVLNSPKRKQVCDESRARLIPILDDRDGINRIVSVGHNIASIESNTQDYVFITNVLQYILYPKLVLEEADRILKKDGKIYIMGFICDECSVDIKLAFARTNFKLDYVCNKNNQLLFFVVLNKGDFSSVYFASKFSPDVLEEKEFREIFITKDDYLQGGLSHYQLKIMKKYGNSKTNRSKRLDELFLEQGKNLVVVRIDNNDNITIKSY